MDDKCILEVDSPSYPPTQEEYEQCGCPLCKKHLQDNPPEEDSSFERSMCQKYPVEDEGL